MMYDVTSRFVNTDRSLLTIPEIKERERNIKLPLCLNIIVDCFLINVFVCLSRV